MDRESLIRRLPELAFAILFGAGAVLGGGAALAGIPRFLDAALPGTDAQADVQDHHGIVRFAMTQAFAESRYAPQVLYPVTAAAPPEWLTEAVREARTGPPPALRGVHELASPARRDSFDGPPLRHIRS